jgi:hypothetical protein
MGLRGGEAGGGGEARTYGMAGNRPTLGRAIGNEL